MGVPFFNNIDYQGNQALNLRLQNAGTAPSSPTAGFLFFNTTAGVNRPQWFYNSAWYDIYPFSTANTANTGVQRDGSGNFAAGTITAALSGNATTATTLATSRNFSITGKGTASAVGFTGAGDVALNITALSVVPGDITLATGSFVYGAAGVGAATAASAIALSVFGAATAAISMGGFKITNLADPTNPQDAATKAYVDATSQGLDIKPSVQYATTAALPASTYTLGTQTITGTANGALTVDGATVSVGSRILVKNQATGSQNGIYSVNVVGDAYTPFTIVRSPDFNSSAEASPGAFTFVEQGSVNADTGWVLTTDAPITLDTTALVFTQFSGAGTYTAGNGVVMNGNQINFAQSSAYTIGDLHYASSSTALSALPDVATGNVLLSGGVGVAPSYGKVGLTTHVSGLLPSANGGTGSAYFGISGPTALRTYTLKDYNAALPAVFSATLTADSTTTAFVVTHNLNTQDVTVIVRQSASPYQQIYTDVTMTSVNAVTVTFAAAPTTGTNYRVTVVG